MLMICRYPWRRNQGRSLAGLVLLGSLFTVFTCYTLEGDSMRRISSLSRLTFRDLDQPCPRVHYGSTAAHFSDPENTTVTSSESRRINAESQPIVDFDTNGTKQSHYISKIVALQEKDNNTRGGDEDSKETSVHEARLTGPNIKEIPDKREPQKGSVTLPARETPINDKVKNDSGEGSKSRVLPKDKDKSYFPEPASRHPEIIKLLDANEALPWSHGERIDHLQEDYVRDCWLENQGSRNWRGLPERLYQLAPMVFDTVPKTFLSKYKNPCWYGTNRQLLCLPYFYLLGFPKAGTTDLWDKINRHPQVIATIVKERHYWRDRQIGNWTSFQRYLSNAMLLTSILETGGTQSVYGDGSASTIVPYYRQVYPKFTVDEEPGEEYTTLDVIKELTPNAKMIIAIREPVERVYSHYRYFTLDHERTVEHFHQTILSDVEMFKECRAKFPGEQCIIKRMRNTRDRLRLGIYAPYIKRWVDGFGSDQVKVVRLEDWRANCTGILPEIFEFLQIDAISIEETNRLCHNTPAKNVNKFTSIGSMLPTTAQLLDEFYRPFNERLASYLNIPVYHARTNQNRPAVNQSAPP